VDCIISHAVCTKLNEGDGLINSNTRRVTIIWLMMLLLTLAVVVLPRQQWLMMAVSVWLVTVAKGLWIIRYFMELNRAPLIWQRILQGWLILTVSAVTMTAIRQL